MPGSPRAAAFCYCSPVATGFTRGTSPLGLPSVSSGAGGLVRLFQAISAHKIRARQSLLRIVALRAWMFEQVTESLYVGVILVIGGASAAAFNLFLARTMPREEYGLLSLIQAISFLSGRFVSLGAAQAVPRLVGPAGYDGINGAWMRLYGRIILRAVVPASVLTGLVAAVWYGWSVFVTVASIFLVAAFGAAVLSGNILRAAARPVIGQAVIQSSRILVFPALIFVLAVSTMELRLQHGLLLLLTVAAVTLAISTATLRPISVSHELPEDTWARLRGDSRQFLGLAISLEAINYIDQLIVPSLLSLEALALYSVLWWLVAMPFKFFRGGLGFTLLPRLRRVRRRREALRIIRLQVGLVVGAALSASVTLSVVTPIILRVLYSGRYAAPFALIVSMVAIGVIQLVYIVPSSMIGAWGDTSALASLNKWGWPSTLVGLCGAWIGGVYFGLVGIALGTGLGFAFRLLAACLLAISSWRRWCSRLVYSGTT
jgi:O-antigen/teichoic acid export membrane protein